MHYAQAPQLCIRVSAPLTSAFTFMSAILLLPQQDREGEGARGDSAFSSGCITPSAYGPAPGSPNARPGSPNLLAALLQSSYQPLVPGVGQMRHGTEGWKCLETSMKAFQQLVEGTGPAVAPYITPDVQDLLYR